MMRTADLTTEAGMTDKRQAFSIKDTAEMLDVHPRTIKRAIKDGQIVITRIRDAVRIPRKEIDRLLTGKGR